MEILTKKRPKTKPKTLRCHHYRIKEANPIYECGWIYISNKFDNYGDAVELMLKLQAKTKYTLSIDVVT